MQATGVESVMMDETEQANDERGNKPSVWK